MATTEPLTTATPSGRLGAGPRRPTTATERVGSVAAHHLLVARRTWKGSVVGRFLSPLFFLLAMGLGLGTLVDERAGGVDGVPYLRFVVPGIIAMQAMMTAFGESTYAVMGYIKWNQMYSAMLSTPLRVHEVLLGHLLVVAGQLTFASGVFVLVAAPFGAFGSPWVVLAVPVAVLTGMAFAVPMFAFAARLDTDSGFSIVFRFVMTPLMLFSGTFFPIEQLPGWMQPVAWVTPLWHGVVLSRDAAEGVAPGWATAGHLAVLLVYVGVGWVLARSGFARRLLP
ncbi:ABC transporter permease [Phycicoccus sp. BSK3Z-2]|uniref:Transport permease protein n=1 Tax=Phycicoccus avicenniae TaxID=2828860 RepID=A0A941I1L0_9MICO|nr:ABC transporter permease [Phycicoccus avicenniae]MBR7744169.1 ABC transporter permease [Phycicoccus avicenniae]